MGDRVTCFKLNWYDCGLSCAEDMVQEEITIYRKDNYMAIKELNGYGVICSCKIIHLEKEKVDTFFAFWRKSLTNGKAIIKYWFVTEVHGKFACGIARIE